KRPKQNYDYAQQHKTPTIDNEAIANHKTRFINPSSFCPTKYYKQLGLRDRILKLSLMVAAVLNI
ncbi:MAG: hypothetical protein ACYTX0_53355, partial [Nostoc sp.]